MRSLSILVTGALAAVSLLTAPSLAAGGGQAPRGGWGSVPHIPLRPPAGHGGYKPGTSWGGASSFSNSRSTARSFSNSRSFANGQAVGGSFAGSRGYAGGNAYARGAANGRSYADGRSLAGSRSYADSRSYANSRAYGAGRVHPNYPHGGYHGGQGFGHGYSRVVRGFVLPSFWLSPSFVVGDWGGWGLGAPGYGQRWIRYYDDALLIDERGRVFDTVEGVGWDGYDARGEDDRVFADREERGPLPPPPGIDDVRPNMLGVSPDYDEGYQDGYDDGFDDGADGVTFNSGQSASRAAGASFGAAHPAPLAYAQPSVTIIQAPPVVTTTTTSYVEEEVVYKRVAAKPKPRKWVKKTCYCR
jgi:Ni/Co efflux regulator RcnB